MSPWCARTNVVTGRSMGVLGPAIAALIIAAWGGHLAWVLTVPGLSWQEPVTWLHLLLQAWLCTGLFITAHDAMHGTISRSRRLNQAVGTVACFLFAGFSYRRLRVNHHRHHANPVTDEDPDFLVGARGFWRWFAVFLWRYATWRQVLVMAVGWNLLQWAGVAQWRLAIFFAAAPMIAAVQLFYFGTYVPHRPPLEAGMGPHRARTQRHNHLWAMLTCYFFGYHQEHHASPGTPWWLLWRVKDRELDARTAMQ